MNVVVNLLAFVVAAPNTLKQRRKPSSAQALICRSTLLEALLSLTFTLEPSNFLQVFNWQIWSHPKNLFYTTCPLQSNWFFRFNFGTIVVKPTTTNLDSLFDNNSFWPDHGSEFVQRLCVCLSFGRRSRWRRQPWDSSTHWPWPHICY